MMEAKTQTFNKLKEYLKFVRGNYTQAYTEELTTCILAYLILFEKEQDEKWMVKLKKYVKQIKKENRSKKASEVCNNTLLMLG